MKRVTRVPEPREQAARGPAPMVRPMPRPASASPFEGRELRNAQQGAGNAAVAEAARATGADEDAEILSAATLYEEARRALEPRPEAQEPGRPGLASAYDSIIAAANRPAGESAGSRAETGALPRHVQTVAAAGERASGSSPGGESRIRDLAAAGVQHADAPLPHADRIQAAFGRHDVSHVRTAIGGAGGDAARQMGARAFTSGNRIAFRNQPDPRLAAHEAAHVVQQRAGVQLDGGVGRAGDRYERQADAVADAVAEGRSAESILDEAHAGGTATGVDLMSGQAGATRAHPADSDEDAPLQWKLDVNAMAEKAGPAAEPIAERHERLEGSHARRFGELLGADFTGVTIHQGDGVAEERGAAAVTFGNDIHFSAASMRGSGDDGLLGHELVHTVQQGAVLTRGDAPTAQGDTASTEAEAEKLGRGAAHGVSGTVTQKAPAAAQARPAQRPAESGVDGEDGADRKLEAERDKMDTILDQPPAAPAGMAEDMAGARAASGGATSGGTTSTGAIGSVGDAGGSMAAAGAARGVGPSNGAPPESRRSGAPVVEARAGKPSAAGAPPAMHPALAATTRPAAPARSPLRTPVPPVAMPARGPSIALAQAIIAEGRQFAEQIIAAGAEAAGAIRARAREQVARLRADAARHAAAVHARAGAVRQQISASEHGASAAVHGSRAGAEAQVVAAGQAQTAQVEQAGQQQRAQAPQAVERETTQFDAAAAAEGERFRQASSNRDQQAQAPVGGGGETAEMKAEASDKIGRAAKQNFAQDAATVDAETQRAAGELRSTLGTGLGDFLGQIDQALPQIGSGIHRMVEGTVGSLAGAEQQVTTGLTSFRTQADGQVESRVAGVIAELGTGLEAMITMIEARAESDAAEVEARAAEAAAAMVEESQAAGASLAGVEGAAEMATPLRGRMSELASQVVAQLRGGGGDASSVLTRQADAGSSVMASGAARVAAGLDAIGAEVGQRMTQAGASAAQQLQTVARSTTQEVQEAGTQATGDLAKAGSDFAASLQAGTTQARTGLTSGVDKADAEQQGKLGILEGKKQDAAAQADAKYAQGKAEADRRAQSQSEDTGQAFLDWILPKSWTDAIKNWFASFMGEWWAGFLWGVINAALAIAVIVVVCLIFPPAAPFIIGGMLLLGAGIGIYSRFQTYEAYNGHGPSFWEGVGLVLLGIADLTGIPSIIEGARGYRFFSGGDTDPAKQMRDFEKGEAVGGGIVQLIGILLAIRGLRGGVKGAPEVKPPEVKPPEVKPPEVKPPEVKPPEVKPPEEKPPEVKPPEEKPPEVKPPEEKPPEVKPPEVKPPEEQPPEVKPPEEQPPEVKPPEEQPPVLAEVPKSWAKFKAEFHEAFRARLKLFRGNDNLEPDFGGGEGKIFAAPGKQVALKRWFAKILDSGKAQEGIKLLEQAKAEVEANPKLNADVEVVKIHEQGPDWILRDFDPRSVELKLGDAAAQAARARAIAELEAMKKNGNLSEVLKDILKKLKKEPPSANLHWSPSKGKIIVIDMK